MKLFLETGEPCLSQHFPMAKTFHYREGQVVCDIDSARTTVYLLLSGQVRVTLMGENGTERLLHYRRNGSLIGDTSCFGHNDLPQGLCAVAVKPSEVLHVPHDEFRCCLATNPNLALSLLGQAYEKIASLVDQLECATFSDTTFQLAALLYAFAREAIRSGATQGTPLVLSVTHQMMAAATGRTRVTVTYSLGRLQAMGIIHLQKGRIEVLDMKALADYASRAGDPGERAQDREVSPTARRSGRASSEIGAQIDHK